MEVTGQRMLLLAFALLTGFHLKKPCKDSYQRETLPAREAASDEH